MDAWYRHARVFIVCVNADVCMNTRHYLCGKMPRLKHNVCLSHQSNPLCHTHKHSLNNNMERELNAMCAQSSGHQLAKSVVRISREQFFLLLKLNNKCRVKSSRCLSSHSILHPYIYVIAHFQQMGSLTIHLCRLRSLFGSRKWKMHVHCTHIDIL